MNRIYIVYFVLLYAGTILSLFLAFRYRNSALGGVLTTGFVLAFCWTLLESVSALRLTVLADRHDAGFVMEGEVTEIDPDTLQRKFKQRDEILGYSGRPGFSGREAKRVGDVYAYDAHYTLTDSGARLVPGSDESAQKMHLFLGDSETFGSGVNDDETFASIYAQTLGNRRVVNASFPGWGPQQALEILRLKAGDYVGEGQVLEQVYFLVCCGHDQRFAGLSTWESEKLVFKLNSEGELVYHGIDRGNALTPWINRLFTVKLVKDIMAGWLIRNMPMEYREDLLREGLIEMKRRAEALGADFTLIYHYGIKETPQLLDTDGLKAADVEIIDVRETMSAELHETGDFRPLDRHPNQEWHAALGKGLAERFQSREP